MARLKKSGEKRKKKAEQHDGRRLTNEIQRTEREEKENDIGGLHSREEREIGGEEKSDRSCPSSAAKGEMAGDAEETTRRGRVANDESEKTTWTGSKSDGQMVRKPRARAEEANDGSSGDEILGKESLQVA